MKAKSQSGLEYILTYSISILFIAIVLVLFYVYFMSTSTIITNKCNFATGAYCNDVIFALNTITQNSIIALSIINTQPYPVASPRASIVVNNFVSNTVACLPGYVASGGAIICVVGTVINASIGSLVTGRVYLNVSYCGLASNTISCEEHPYILIPEHSLLTFSQLTYPKIRL